MHTLGIDLGTSGVRAVLLGPAGTQASCSEPVAAHSRHDPAALWAAVAAVMQGVPLGNVAAIAIAGTSGTVLATARDGKPVTRLSLYHETASPADVAAVAAAAPPASPAQGHTSPLARAIALSRTAGAARILHEADWVAGQLSGQVAHTDENNALKTGYDPLGRHWPDWITQAGLDPALLPRALPPGTPIAPVAATIAARFGLDRSAVLVAGTTDGCASFISTGCAAPGDAVTVLGSTLTVKLLSDTPVSAPEMGVYSHRLWNTWLPGGASNSGGAVLAAHFNPAEITSLSRQIDPARDSGLDYYPLPRPGERFPINDPALSPRLSPRPASDAHFLHGLLEGIARIEQLGYQRLAQLGAPPPTRVITLGGGAGNRAWTAIRSRLLGVPVIHRDGTSAAHGAALLARRALTSPAASGPSTAGSSA